nr:hypothetical protein [Klebsiella pneumoniae subsp. pneumoniae]
MSCRGRGFNFVRGPAEPALDKTFTRLRAVRRKGVNEHGRRQLSVARFTACHLPGRMMATVVVSAQANGLKRVIRHQGKEQAPAATTKSAGAKRRCLQSAGSFIAGTVKAARPERSQQALLLTLTSDIRH